MGGTVDSGVGGGVGGWVGGGLGGGLGGGVGGGVGGGREMGAVGTFAASACFCSLAFFRAVLPNLSRASTAAPDASKYWIAPVSPVVAATCSAVNPNLSLPSKLAPALIITSMASV